ncbi:MucB/RseB C-terminal domain-containing protein [Gilliamella apicola]|uniref:MucB/RseB C-terminal domain-containing protein n=1 Tax=Gilliamella apicola TaxID=1196095 RepID=UPI0015E8C82D|nr:MucB/RseB C-terminal domain-containing protein [Gilliamella apicola]
MFSTSAIAAETNEALNLLNKMGKAVQTSDYQIHFLSQDREQFATTFEYNHLGAAKKDNINAQLLYLEGPAKEIILHNNTTSYFQPDSPSFSIASSRITEAFPDVVYNDFNSLASIYDFILLGKTRTANRGVQLVKVIAKDKDRYSYVIWIDDENFLPLRIDLIDDDNNIVNQLKVLDIDASFDAQKFKNYIDNRTYPILLSIEKQNNLLDAWRLAWLPKGFKEIAAYNVNFYSSDIATKLFSDGVFSFTVNVSLEQASQSNQLIQQGGRTIFSTNLGNKNIIIIGNLPEATIERIAQNIVEKSPETSR